MANAKTTEAVAVVPAEPETTSSDTTIPGGRYEVNGQIVDANGKPIKDVKTDDGETEDSE